MFPERINLLVSIQDLTPAALDRSVERDELGFLDREVIPRLFAEAVAFLALVQAALHVGLSTAHFVSLLIFIPLAQRSSYLAIFERAKNQLFHAIDDACLGTGIVYGLWDPARVVEAAFPEEQTPEVPINFHGFEEENVSAAADLEIEEEIIPRFHAERTFPKADVVMEELVMPEFHLDHSPPPVSDRENRLPETPHPKVVEIVQVPTLPPEKATELEKAPSAAPTPQDPYLAISEPVAYVLAIKEMIHVLGSTSVPMLAFKKATLKKKGEEISSHGVHTLKFLECVCRDSETRTHFLKIQSSYFKWNGFLKGENNDGTGAELDKLAAAGKLDPHLPGFVNALRKHNLHADLVTLQQHVGKKDWENMIKYLIGLKPTPGLF